MRKIIILICISLLINGCSIISSKEVAKVSFDNISTSSLIDWKEVELDLIKEQKVFFWTKLDINYKNELQLEYKIQIICNSDTLGYISLNALEKEITVGELKSFIGNETNWSFTGYMNFFKIKRDGHYKFRILLVSNLNNTLKLNKAIFILKV